MRRRVVIVSLAVVLAAVGMAAYLVRGTFAALRDEIREVGWANVRADPGLAYGEARLRANMAAAGWTVLPDRGLGDARLRQPLAVAVSHDDPALGPLVLWVWNPPKEEGSILILVLRRTEGPPTIDDILGEYGFQNKAGTARDWRSNDATPSKFDGRRYIGFWLKPDWRFFFEETSGPCFPAASKLRHDYDRALLRFTEAPPHGPPYHHRLPVDPPGRPWRGRLPGARDLCRPPRRTP